MSESNGADTAPAVDEQGGEPTGKPADLQGQRINILTCASCDGKHEAMAVQSLVRPSGPYSHWYKCPSTGDPVPVSVMALSGNGALELDGRIRMSLARAQLAGKFVVFIAHITAQGGIQLDRTSCHFPREDFFGEGEIGSCPEGKRKGVFDLIRDNLIGEVGKPQPAVMAQANPTPMSAGVFGDAIREINQLPG